jgi:hypothetical protein
MGTPIILSQEEYENIAKNILKLLNGISLVSTEGALNIAKSKLDYNSAVISEHLE